MKREIDLKGTYVLQLTAYLMYFYHRDIYGQNQEVKDKALEASDPEFYRSTLIMRQVMKAKHYSESYRGLFEVYYGKKFDIPEEGTYRPYKGSVILYGHIPHYVHGGGALLAMGGSRTHLSSRTWESPKMANLEEIGRFFLALRLAKTTRHKDDTAGYEQVILDTNFEPKGGIAGAGRFKDKWAVEALESMFSSKPSITLVEGLTKLDLLAIIDEKLEEQDNPTLRSFRRVLYSQT